MSRQHRPRPPEVSRDGLLPVTCDCCGRRGLYAWRRGVVIHSLTPNCDVQIPAVEDDETREAA